MPNPKILIPQNRQHTEEQPPDILSDLTLYAIKLHSKTLDHKEQTSMDLDNLQKHV